MSEVRNVADLDLRKCIQEKLSDLDGTSFLIRLYSNGKAMNGLVDEVASAISKHDLTASEAKGFLEYMKIVIDSHSHIQKKK